MIGAFGEMVTYQTASIAIGPDERGNDVTIFTPGTVGPCAFEPGAEAEAAIGTEQVTATGKCYLPSGTPVSPLDRIERANGEVYEITGEGSAWTSPFTGLTSPVVVSVRRVTGATAHLTTESDT